jgi:CRISPR-associated protein Csy1
MTNDEIAQALANEISNYVKMRRDDKEEKYLKIKAEKNKQGVINNGAINERLLVVVKKLGRDKNRIEIVEKSKKTKDQTSLEFQQKKYSSLISIMGDDVFNQELSDLKKEYFDFVLANDQEHETVTWLNQWVNKATDISFATHVGKLTHSSSKSSSVLDATTEKNDRYLSTNRLSNMEIDTASSNAASLPIADVLKLAVDGVSVLDCLKNDENALFKKLTDDASIVNEWCSQLKQSYDSTQKQTYFLSKQVYFPAQDRQYHLLMPLMSSSLVHALHLTHKKYWDDGEQENARSQRSNKKYSATITCTYPSKAYLHVTGSNHSNASSLNGQRGGRIALFPSMPPQWRTRLISYVSKTSLFDKTLAYELKDEINELKNYLLLMKNKSLSISEPQRNAAVINKLQDISGQLFNYLEKISANEGSHGWTVNSKLPIEEQLAFEPWRKDEVAQAKKISNEWQKVFSQNYGRWLNQQLATKSKLNPTAIHAALWADCFLNELREMVATQEVAL